VMTSQQVQQRCRTLIRMIEAAEPGDQRTALVDELAALWPTIPVPSPKVKRRGKLCGAAALRVLAFRTVQGARA